MDTKKIALLGLAALGSTAILEPSDALANLYTGNVVPNALGGNVQVQITIDNGVITTINTPVIPSGANAAYANMAIPTLVSEAISAQSANIQGVSGASYFSNAWKQSLASAIASAGSSFGTTGTPTPAPVPTLPPPTTTITGSGEVTTTTTKDGQKNVTVCTQVAPLTAYTTVTQNAGGAHLMAAAVRPQVSETENETHSPRPSATRTPTPEVSVPATSTPSPSRPSTTPSRAPQEGNDDAPPVIVPTPTPTVSRTPTPTPGVTTPVTINGIQGFVITQTQLINCTTTIYPEPILVTLTPSPAPTVTVTATPAPAPTVTVTAEPVLTIPKKSVITRTITCLKGKSKKVVKGTAPKCPKGYKLKK